VGVGINPAGSHEHPIGVDDLLCRVSHSPDIDNGAVTHGYFTREWCGAGAVDDRAPLDDEIVHSPSFFSTVAAVIASARLRTI